MDNKYDFIYKTSNKEKIKVFIISVIVIASLVAGGFILEQTVYDKIRETVFFGSIGDFFKTEITKLTPTGLFYTGFLGASIFVPMPIEILYYIGLTKGSPVILSFFLINLGIFLAQIVNYWIGSRFSPLLLHFVSTRKIYKVRRFINKYGAYGIFFFNIIPTTPSEILTFALGITKYNVMRLFTLMTAAVLIKYVVISAIYLILH